jgi:hypothetical protein
MLLLLLLQSLDVTVQVLKLIDKVEAGARDFVPTPYAMSSAAQHEYHFCHTLILQIKNDTINYSLMLEGSLCEAESVMKMKRPPTRPFSSPHSSSLFSALALSSLQTQVLQN